VKWKSDGKTHVVTKHVLDELQRVVRNNLTEDNLLLIAAGSLKLLLDETRTVLVAAEFHDISKDILKEELT
jgi:hypothetical protein